MKAISGFLKILILVLVVLGAAFFVISQYSYVFSKNVVGTVVDVERVTDPTAVIGGRATEAQMYSYSILIQGDDGHLYTSSSEDRQWQVVKKGYCVQVLLFRYPPWDLNHAGTFFNARLKDVKVCAGQAELPPVNSSPSAPPASETTPAPNGSPNVPASPSLPPGAH